ncbi:MAG: alpha-2-macroglobulin family protein [Leptonema sp. (in: bacteria)]
MKKFTLMIPKAILLLFVLVESAFTQNFKKEPVLASFSEDLEVISVVPTGNLKINQIKEIVITFNQPMISLSKREETEKKIPFQIEPNLKGNIHWYGVHTVALEVTDNGIPGQTYKVIIPEGIQSIHGKKLRKRKIFEFTIEPFDITSIYPDPQKAIDLDSSITIFHNLPLESIEQNLSVYKKNIPLVKDKDYEISIPEMSEYDSPSFTIHFKKYLPPNEELKIKISRNAKIKNSNIRIGKDYLYKFSTKGSVEVNLINQARFFQDYYSLALEFTNPILLKENSKYILILDRNGQEIPLKNDLDLEPQTRIYLSNWKISSGESYAIVVKKGLKDIFGTILSESKSFRIDVPILQPNFYYREGDYFYEGCAPPKQNFYYSNIMEIYLGTTKLNLKNFLNNNIEKLMYNNQKIQITSKTNQEGYKTIDFHEFLQKHQNCYYGWLAIKLSGDYFSIYENKYLKKNYYQTIQFTDIGLTILQSPNKIKYVAQSLSSGKFLENLNIQLYSKANLIDRCITNSSGICEIKTNTGNLELASLGEYQKDKILLKHNDHNFIYDFDREENTDQPKILGFVIYDRKLYRPGETVFYKAYIHYSKSGKFYPINSPTTKFKIKIANSRAEEIYSKIVTTNHYSSLQDSITIPNDAPTGYYNLEIEPILFLNQNLKLNSIYSTFQVEEFRPLTFTANILGIKDQFSLKIPSFLIEGKYLFGAPLSGAKVELNFSYQPIYNNFKDGYSTKGLWESKYEIKGFLLREIINLNSYGKYQFPEKEIKIKEKGFKYVRDFKKENDKIIRLKWENLELKENYNINLEAKIYDLSKRSITKFVNFSTFTSKDIPAIKLNHWITQTNKEFTFSIANFNAETKEYSYNSAKLEIYIFKEEWNTIATKAGEDKVEKEKVYTPILKLHKTILVEKEKPIQFIPNETGSYKIILKNEQGSYAETTFYVSGEGFSYWNEEQDNLKLIPDKTIYDLDDNAKILIQSPYEKANALIAIVGEDFYEEKIINDIPSSYLIDLKMKKEYFPGIYITVVLFKPRQNTNHVRYYSKDPGKPQLKMGKLYLEFSKESRKLPITMEFNCNPCKPRDTIKIKIQTEPNAEIALSVADKAVLDLIDYHYSDPLPIMYPKRSYAIKIFDNRLTLLDQFLELKKGDEAGGDQTEVGGFNITGDDGARKNFKFTAYWNPSIIADKNGIAEIEFKLPDNTTTFRIMVMATVNGKFGNYEKEFIVQKELVIVPTLPNFLRIGEKIQIGGLIVNNTYKTQDFSVSLESNPKICVENKKNITLTSMQSAPILWECEYKKDLFKIKKTDSKSYIEDVEFTLTSGSKEYSDKIKQKIPVMFQTYREAFSDSGIIQKEVTKKIDIPDPEKNPGFIFLNLSASILSNLKNSLEYFELNPYLCLEQRASAFYIHTLANKHNIKKEVYGTYEYKKSKKLFLEELPEFINYDGGLKLWKESNQSNLYITLYILEILYRLEQNQVLSLKNEPYRTMIQNSFNYAKKEFNNKTNFTEFSYLESLFYYFYVANLYQEPIKKEFEKSLQSFKNNPISFRSKGYILLLLEKFKMNSELTNQFLQEFINSLKFTTRKIYIQDNIPYYSSQQSFYTNISSLTPWLEYFIGKSLHLDLLSKIIQGIIARNIYYSSSFEESRLIYILDLYKTKIEKSQNTSLDLFFEDKKINTYSFKSDVSEFKEKFLFDDYKYIKSILMKNQNPNSILYYTITLDYLLSIEELSSVNEGFYIKKNLFYYDEIKRNFVIIQPKDNSYTLEEGKIYLVELNLVNIKPIQNFVIEDPISSLTEIVNLSFETESMSQTEQTENEEKQMFDDYTDAYSTEIYKDRYLIRGEYLTAGNHKFQFLIRPISKGLGYYLPTIAKAIYEPEIYGRSDLYKIIVK